MYNVSVDYYRQLHAPARFEHCRGTIGAVAFDDNNIIDMRYTNRCSDTADITFGSAYIGQLTAVFTGLSIERGSWKNRVITVEAGLELTPEVIEWVPLGQFTIASAEWTDQGVSITANDPMEKLDKNLDASNFTPGSVYQMAKYCCDNCGAVFGMTAEEVEQLTNGAEQLSLYFENNVKTYRDFMSSLAAALAAFVTCNRSGQIVFRQYGETPVDVLSASERIGGSVFSDYSTYYDGVSVVNIADQTLSYYSAGSGDGSAIKLGSNPFLQYGLDYVRDAERQAIAEKAHGLVYTPFTTSILSTIVYDLGDAITCTGGIAGGGNLTCCIMSIDWTLKQAVKFQGFGADPRLATGKSKTDKDLSGIMSKTDTNVIGYYNGRNMAEITLGDQVETTIGEILFAAEKATQVEVWVEAKINVQKNEGTEEQVPVWSEVPDPEPDPEDPEPEPIITQIGWWDNTVQEPMTGHVRYYLDGVLIEYQPIETWNEDGEHTIHYGYFLPSIDEVQTHTWRVTLELDGGTGEIAVDDVNILLKGQALVGTEFWDGTITAQDQADTPDIRPLTPADYEDTPEITIYDGEDMITPAAADEIQTPDIRPLTPAEFEESVRIVLNNLLFNIVTENDVANIVTEDGIYNITTEDDNNG